jgi:hypothetical protein
MWISWLIRRGLCGKRGAILKNKAIHLWIKVWKTYQYYYGIKDVGYTQWQISI